MGFEGLPAFSEARDLDQHLAPNYAGRNRFWAGGITGSPFYNLLMRMEAAALEASKFNWAQQKRHAWPLRFRSELRKLFTEFDIRWNAGELEILQFYMIRCPFSMVPVCVWIFSRLSNRENIGELKSLRNRLPPSTRKHLAKALRRLQAWSLLGELAAENPHDGRIQWFAHAAPTQLSFARRLERFTASVDQSHATEVQTPSQMKYWDSGLVWQLTPPKSRELIRRILKHIHRLVRRPTS
jgi:hypothetical protein